MRLTRPGADQTPEGSAPNAPEKACKTVSLAESRVSGEAAISAEAGNSAHLTQPGCHSLGCDVVDPGPGAGLGTREVLQPAGRPKDGHHLQVKTGDVAPLANRCLVPACDVEHLDRRQVRHIDVPE